MKTLIFPRVLTLTFLLGLTLIFILPPKTSGQDTVSPDKKKVITLKIRTSDDGSGVSIDTTIILDDEFNEEMLEEYLEGVEESMKSYQMFLDIDLQEENLKEMEQDLRKMERDMRQSRIEWYGKDGCWNYRYDYPGGKHGRGDCVWISGDDVHTFSLDNRKNKGESLADVLGDIPMSAVTGYKIKETKNGKRITIEVSNDYSGNDRDEIVIVRTPSSPRLVREATPNVRQIRVIKSDQEGDVAGEKEIEVEVEVESPDDKAE